MNEPTTAGRVAPTTAAEVARLLAEASLEGRSVRPVGAGSWAGAWGLDRPAPAAPALTLALDRFDTVVEYEPADLTLTLGAGVTLAGINELTEPHGQWLALDPVAAAQATIGATVATASAGALRCGYHGAREHVLGLTLITGDGRELELGGRVVKNVAGFDLLKLMVGGWGRFGVITQLTLRLHPRPVHDVTLIAEADDPNDLVATARALATAAIVPASLRLEVGPRHLVAARVVGGEAAAPAEVALLQRAADGAGPALRRLEGEQSSAFWSARQEPTAQADTEVAVHFRPAELGSHVPFMRAAAEAGWTVSCDASNGACDVVGDHGSVAALHPWFASPVNTQLLRAPDSVRAGWSDSPTGGGPVAKLVERLEAAFDPHGILG